MWTYNQTEELYHHGVLGMKWGQRRARMREHKRIKQRIHNEAVNSNLYKHNWNIKAAKRSVNSQAKYNIANSLKKGISTAAGAELAMHYMNRAINGSSALRNTKIGSFYARHQPKIRVGIHAVNAGVRTAQIMKSSANIVRNNIILNKKYNEHLDKLAAGRYKPSTRAKNKDIYKGMYD